MKLIVDFVIRRFEAGTYFILTAIVSGIRINLFGYIDRKLCYYKEGEKETMIPCEDAWKKFNERIREAGYTEATDKQGYPIELLEIFTDPILNH